MQQIGDCGFRQAPRLWVIAALGSQLALAVYLQVVEWVPLAPWNNISGGNGQEKLDITLGALQLALLYVFWKRWKWLMALGTALYGFWMYLQIRSWWVPYLRGASPAYMRFYQRWFGKTYKIVHIVGNGQYSKTDGTVQPFC